MIEKPRSIRTEFKNFVKHAEIIHMRGNPLYYHNADRLEALEKCLKFSCYVDVLDQLHICRVIIKLHPDLEKILPVPSNLSYSSSLERLNHMLTYCIKINNESLITTS